MHGFFIVDTFKEKYWNISHKKKGHLMTKSSFNHFLFLCMVLPFSFYAQCAVNEKHFVIVIPSYNNSRWYERNIASVLSQNYDSFDVIYTDDCSPDGTGHLVEQYLQQNDNKNKITLIKNEVRRGALHNLYLMINMCPDDSIIVTLDGDDWFPDDEVLTRLNEAYTDEVWLTYGQFKLHPSGIQGWASPMPDYIVENNAFRDFQHLPTHLRTFYAWLFKQIKLEDFLYLGQFYPMTWDMVMMFPMIEMAGERHRFISDIMYIYNDENNISDHNVSRQLQAHLAQVVKQKNRYKRLPYKPVTTSTSSSKSDVIIFAQTPSQLSNLLTSLDTYVDGLGNIYVMYKPISINEAEDYDMLQKSYPEVEFHLIYEHRSNFRETLFNIYKKSPHNYILFSKGDTTFQEYVSLSEAINLLQKKNAYAFYFKLNAQDGMKKYPHLPLIECENDISAWNFAFARDKWSCANSLDLVLHKKTDSLFYIMQGHYDLTPKGLEAIWANEGNLDKLGLCFCENKLEHI
jgi:glycosyltransferase involved in cell wall biosynthesis